ncbi:MAG: hypothetical protein ACMUIL_09830 [bacterium]
MFLKSFIVRIYRCEGDNPHKLIGSVEEIGDPGKMAFTNPDELWSILTCASKKALPVKEEQNDSHYSPI